MTRDLDPQAERDGHERAPAAPPGGERLRSIPGLLAALARDIGMLLRKETELARTELAEKFDQASSGVSQLGTAALLTYAGVLLLLAALVLLVNLWLAVLWASAALIGVLVTAVGLVLLGRGRRKLRTQNLTPERTAHSLWRDMRVAHEELERVGAPNDRPRRTQE